MITATGTIDGKGTDGISVPARTASDLCTANAFKGGPPRSAAKGSGFTLIARNGIQNNGIIDVRGGDAAPSSIASSCAFLFLPANPLGVWVWFDRQVGGQCGMDGGKVVLGAPFLISGTIRLEGGRGGEPARYGAEASIVPGYQDVVPGGCSARADSTSTLTTGPVGLVGDVSSYLRTRPELLVY